MFHVKHRRAERDDLDKPPSDRKHGKNVATGNRGRLPGRPPSVYWLDVAESVVADANSGERPLASCRGSTVMSLLVAAVGAVAAALVDLTIAPYLTVAGVHPDFVLILAIIWTVVNGIEGGLIWAFIGGLMIDFLAPRPLGSTAFTLLVCVGGATLFSRSMGRFRYLMPIVAVFAFSIVYGLLFLVVYGALRGSIPAADPIGSVLPAAVYDVIVAAIIGPLAVTAIARRQPDRDRLDW
jgi:rod shape-determining protein MreD